MEEVWPDTRLGRLEDSSPDDLLTITAYRISRSRDAKGISQQRSPFSLSVAAEPAFRRRIRLNYSETFEHPDTGVGDVAQDRKVAAVR
jgi:hypothetical protein